MKAKRPHLFIGTGLVVALSCGLAPLPAFASTVDDSVVQADVTGIQKANAAIGVSQTQVPTLAPGQTGKITFRLTPTTKGALSYTVTAPSGTEFASATREARTSSWSGTTQATLSPDRKSITYTNPNYDTAGGGWAEETYTLRSLADNAASGTVSDGEFLVTAGVAIAPGTSVGVAYNVKDTLTQTQVPTLAPGQTGKITFRVSPTGKGAFSYKVTAPSGTEFAGATREVRTATWSGSTQATLSADRKTITYSNADYDLSGGTWADETYTLRSLSDNTASGTVTDGEFLVTGGATLAPGKLAKVAYESSYVAPKIDPVVLSAPAIGGVVTDTMRPMFSGTANPGTTVTVKGSSGRVVATTTAKADGSWSVPASFDLVNGSYFGTVTQSADGSSARYEFSMNVAPEPKVIVTPVTITGPALDAKLQAGKPVFTGKGHPGATVVVKGAFGTALGSGVVDAQGNWSVTSTVSLGAASYSGTAVQTVNGETSSAGFRFVIEKAEAEITPVTLTAPAVGTEINAGKPVFQGKGHPGATVTVQGTFGTPLGSSVVDANGNWSIESTVSLVVGSYSGTAKQNVDGKVSSAAFSFKAVQNTAVTLTSPAIDAVVAAGKPVFTGTGKPGATVTVQGQFGTPLGSGVVNANGNWSIESTVTLVAGTYAGSAKQDVDGKVTTAPFKFTAQ